MPCAPSDYMVKIVNASTGGGAELISLSQIATDMGWGVPRSQSSATRTLGSGFQISTTRDALVNYSVDVSCTSVLTGGQTGTVYLEIASDSGFTTNLQELGRFVNGNTQTLGLSITLVQNVTGSLGGYVPVGYWTRLRTQSNTGTPTFTYRSGQEVLL